MAVESLVFFFMSTETKIDLNGIFFSCSEEKKKTVKRSSFTFLYCTPAPGLKQAQVNICFRKPSAPLRYVQIKRYLFIFVFILAGSLSLGPLHLLGTRRRPIFKTQQRCTDIKQTKNRTSGWVFLVFLTFQVRQFFWAYLHVSLQKRSVELCFLEKLFR